MLDSTLLIGDIGGTNARFALADTQAPGFSDLRTMQCANFVSAEAAIEHYLNDVSAPSPNVICLATAGPVVDRRVQLTNNAWRIAADQIASAYSASTVHLLNDFEAIAYSLPCLDSDDFLSIGPLSAARTDIEDYTAGILGPGTGLGMVGVKTVSGRLSAIAGEASHGGFAPESSLQIDVLKTLRKRFDRVSIERLVSGPGLENIHRALCAIHGDVAEPLSAARIFASSEDNTAAHTADAVQLFFEILGQVAGDLALTLGVDHGIYIAGGIARRYPELLQRSPFRAGFENKGRHRSIMERIPTILIMHEQPGLLGAGNVARQILDGD